MKYPFFQLKKTSNPMCFPFSCDKLSSKKFLKFSFFQELEFASVHLEISITITSIAFPELHRPEVIRGAQHQVNSWGNKYITTCCYTILPSTSMSASSGIMNPAGLSQKNQEQFFPGGCLPSNKIN